MASVPDHLSGALLAACQPFGGCGSFPYESRSRIRPSSPWTISSLRSRRAVSRAALIASSCRSNVRVARSLASPRCAQPGRSWPGRTDAVSIPCAGWPRPFVGRSATSAGAAREPRTHRRAGPPTTVRPDAWDDPENASPASRPRSSTRSTAHPRRKRSCAGRSSRPRTAPCGGDGGPGSAMGWRPPTRPGPRRAGWPGAAHG